MTTGPHLVGRKASRPGPPERLSRAECLRLLEQVEVARVAWVDGDQARVVPVVIAVRDDAIVFRTGPGRKLDAAAAGARFTVEAEQIEPALHLGWSVEVVGRACVESGTAEDQPMLAPWLQAWVPLESASFIRVAIEEINGRRLPQRPAPVELWSWAKGAS